jgi:hypothetical protein
MAFAFGKNTKTNLTNTIKNKQQAYNRFNKRFTACRSPSEKTFLKAEMSRCVRELKQFAIDWKRQSFGNPNWITKSCCNVVLAGNQWVSTNSPAAKATGGAGRKPIGRRTTSARKTTRASAGSRTGARRTIRTSASKRTGSSVSRRRPGSSARSTSSTYAGR